LIGALLWDLGSFQSAYHVAVYAAEYIHYALHFFKMMGFELPPICSTHFSHSPDTPTRPQCQLPMSSYLDVSRSTEGYIMGSAFLFAFDLFLPLVCSVFAPIRFFR
jgi:hypothetical protein